MPREPPVIRATFEFRDRFIGLSSIARKYVNKKVSGESIELAHGAVPRTAKRKGDREAAL
jgi:hypothetical protein